MPKFDDRFARQNRCEPPPEFPLASPYSSIVHHLSGPTKYALTQTLHRRSRSVDAAPCGSHLVLPFSAPMSFCTRKLAYVIDSLVRVSRRVGRNHLGRIALACPQSIRLFCLGTDGKPPAFPKLNPVVRDEPILPFNAEIRREFNS